MKDDHDLFVDEASQASLFGDGEDRMPVPRRRLEPDPDKIRRRLAELLAELRAADRMPWPEREARMWRALFPNMANWLPPEEADDLRRSFDREFERLAAAT